MSKVAETLWVASMVPKYPFTLFVVRRCGYSKAVLERSRGHWEGQAYWPAMGVPQAVAAAVVEEEVEVLVMRVVLE